MKTYDVPTIDVAQLDAALAVAFDSDAGDGLTVREWLTDLLMTVWVEEEEFSGKRAWGNSGWQWDVYPALVAGGFIAGTVDSEGYIDTLDTAAAHAFVRALILRMCGARP